VEEHPQEERPTGVSWSYGVNTRELEKIAHFLEEILSQLLRY